LFLVPYPIEGASNRYRVEQYLPYLEKAGIEYRLKPFWSNSGFRLLYKPGQRLAKFYFFLLGSISRLFDLFTLFRYDTVFIHREAYPIGGAFFERILRILKKPFIFDFDDAIYLATSSHSNYFVEKYKRPDRVAAIIKMSKHVIAGNEHLAEFARNYNGSVSVIPTPIDTDRYCPNQPNSSAEVTIGWIGSVTTISFLNLLRNVFIRFSREFPSVKFKIVGGNFNINNLSNIICKPWSLAEELEDLSSFDIGVMPMPEDRWTEGKCGFKAILYMSMGIATVCSPVGVNKTIISDGLNGFLAKDEQEWFTKLSRLVEDVQLRKRLASAGRKTVEERYSLSVNLPAFLKVLTGK